MIWKVNGTLSSTVIVQKLEGLKLILQEVPRSLHLD